MSTQYSFSNLIDEAINIYSSLLPLLSKGNLDDKKVSNSIIEFIDFLKNIKRQKDFTTLNAWPPSKIHYFFKFLLDASGIVSATEGNFHPLHVGDADIGPKGEIGGILSGQDEEIDDWMCSILFRGWVKLRKPTFRISRDLRYDVPKREGQGICDFKIQGDSVWPTLVECKRIHPAVNEKSYSEMISKVAQKIVEGPISKAEKQFEDTEEYLNEGKFYRLLILDIASYGSNSVQELHDMKTIGLQTDSDIDPTINELKHWPISGIDEITVCWSDVYYFHGAPRALAYYTYPICLSQEKKNNLNYQGWTIELYPRGKQLHEFRELRISTTARSRAWIKASWYSSTDNLLTYGPEERLEDT